MTLALPYRAKIARSHSLWVIGALGQAVFGEIVPIKTFEYWQAVIRPAFKAAENNERAYEDLMRYTATMEEVIAEAANARTG